MPCITSSIANSSSSSRSIDVYVCDCVCLLFGGTATFGQYLLDGLLFFQQECPDDACLDALVATRSTVGPTDLALTLRRASIGGGFQVLDARQYGLAIGTLGSGGFLGDGLEFHDAPRRTDPLVRGRSGIVRGTSLTRPTMIRHDFG
eukprot:scaffold1221_cov207-Amphora_coffeaeformis.AAC.49